MLGTFLMRVALHPVCCLCSFHVRARSSRVKGWSVFFALNRSQIVYVPRISQIPIISRVNIFVIYIVVLHVYDMSYV